MTSMSAHGEVAVFFTGGTIGMSPSEGVHGVAPGGNFSNLLNQLAPQPEGIRLRPVRWSDKPSPHMTPEDMFRLSKDIQAALDEDVVLGAVVLHGTDVLAESAYMADLVVQSPKPVLFTGSMRYYSESGYDGLRNLINAVRAVLLPLPAGTGACVLMTDRIFPAREAVKVNSLNVDAFESREAGVVGYVAGESVVLAGCPQSTEPGLKIAADHAETSVVLLTCFTGMGPNMLDHVRENGAKGVVVEGFGAGNVPPNLVPAIERCLEAGLPVVLATRCIEGGVWPIYGYPGGGADLVDKGVLLCGRLGGAKARIKLMLALGAGMDGQGLKHLFD